MISDNKVSNEMATKWHVDEVDGRKVYEPEIGELVEIEVEKDRYESFRCVETERCHGCDFNLLSFEWCLAFQCRHRQDGKNVRFTWEAKNA